MGRALRALVVSDFNVDSLAALLTHDETPPALAASAIPFGQWQQVLLNPEHACWSPRPDLAVVWTRPEAACPRLAEWIAGSPTSQESLLEEVDQFCAAVERARPHAATWLIPTWTVAPEFSSGSLLDLSPDRGVTRAVAAMNERLLAQIQAMGGVYPLDAETWLRGARTAAYQPKLWYMAKQPFGNDVYTAAVREIKSALAGLSGESRKLIVLDLDHTLWGGIAAEVGWQKLVLGGHAPAGEAYVDFQKALLALKRRGVLLAVVSKNEEHVALEAIRSHPEMALSEQDFCGQRIDWRDKAQNIVELVTELNLGLNAVVFIDDSPVERARVREALPEVLVPEWPKDPMLYRQALAELRCFNVPGVSTEDAGRTEMYRDEKARLDLRSGAGSVEEWLKSLATRVSVEPLNAGNLARAAQLLNKTNQFNLATRRLTEHEFQEWAAARDHHVWTFRVSDRVGDSGLTGLVSMAMSEKSATVVDFVLSCRVMGRRIEDTMLQFVLGRAHGLGAQSVTAAFIPTQRNAPCLRFLESAADSGVGDPPTFSWKPLASPKWPDGITLELKSP